MVLRQAMPAEVHPLRNLPSEPLEAITVEGSRGFGRESHLGAGSFWNDKETLLHLEHGQLPGVARLVHGGIVRDH